jgi:hypothetical protein
MNRAAQLFVVVVLVAAGALLPLFAQIPTSDRQIPPTPPSQMSASPMSTSDMETHMKGTMSHMNTLTPMMQSNPQLQLLLDRMKSLGADLNLLLNRIQVISTDKAITQDKLKMQHVQNVSRHIQTMIQSVDGVVGEMEQMQQGK